ncbi:MAG: outer membrane protein OmpA-like peptidoglycan-associated protein [Paraglaciecola psychrophila]|jgi:outer membrane protein OmpA-like peptidoglycan-associated protein
MFVVLLRISAVVLMMSYSTSLWAVVYGPSMHQAEWRLRSSVFECRLWQPIPAFGEAVFSNRAGEDQRFHLAPVKVLLNRGKASLFSEAPLWDDSRSRENLGYVAVTDNSEPVRLGKDKTYRLLNELYGGMSPVFTRQSWYQRDESIQVFLSSIHFRKAYREYLGCLSGLLPANFDQIVRSRIHFDSNESELTASSKTRLDHIVLYVKADPLEISFYVDGHTDDRGRRLENLKLSKRRAEVVTRYLIARGVSEALIVTRQHGEAYPVINNKSAKNRAANRRVTIRLEREGDV